MDFIANFELIQATPITASFAITQQQPIDATFEIKTNNSPWGSITGLLSNQTDLQNALNLKSDSSFSVAMSIALGG